MFYHHILNKHRKSINQYNLHSKVIKNEKTGMEFACKYEDFLPIRKGDMILGIAEVKLEKGIQLLVFNDKPIVKVGIDAETIQSCFILAQNNSGTKFYDRHANALFKSIQDVECRNLPEHEQLKHMDDELNKLASLNSVDNKHIGWLENKSHLITETQAVRLLKWWQRNRNVRRLWLLGLNDGEIFNIKQYTKLTITEIYDKCMKDPYYIYPINMDKCEILIKYFGEHIPAMTAVEVVQLWNPHFLVEVEAVAVVNEEQTIIEGKETPGR
jgi:hypothetical protein